MPLWALALETPCISVKWTSSHHINGYIFILFSRINSTGATVELLSEPYIIHSMYKFINYYCPTLLQRKMLSPIGQSLRSRQKTVNQVITLLFNFLRKMMLAFKSYTDRLMILWGCDSLVDKVFGYCLEGCEFKSHVLPLIGPWARPLIVNCLKWDKNVSNSG